MAFGGKLHGWARRLRRDLVALHLALTDRRVPWYAKLLAGVAIAYALSPIDLIPDAIPVLGLLDDLLLVPLALWLAIRLLPPGLIEEYRQKASADTRLPVSRRAVAVIVGIWILLALALATWLYRFWSAGWCGHGRPT